jgi:ABC-2 type transport system ATP-binding protein
LIFFLFLAYNGTFPMAAVLKVDNVRKSFSLGLIPKKKEILKGISFEVAQGEIFGYLGPNGAGKTTTLKCVLGLIYPDAGTIELWGMPHLALKAKARVGFLPENPYFYDYLTGEEFLDFYGQLFSLSRTDRRARVAGLLKLVDMTRAAGLQLRKYSRGMLQRIGLAQALINNPSFVALDEPMGGLDPLGRKEFRDIIVRLRDEGKTVLLSSHILQDIEMICTRVAIVLGGRVVSQGALRDLISQKILFTEVEVAGLPESELHSFGDCLSASGGRTLLKIHREDLVAGALSHILSRRGKVLSLIPRTQTLEDLFVDIVKKE